MMIVKLWELGVIKGGLIEQMIAIKLIRKIWSVKFIKEPSVINAIPNHFIPLELSLAFLIASMQHRVVEMLSLRLVRRI